MSSSNTSSNKNDGSRFADAARDARAKAADTLHEVRLASNQIVDKVRELIEEGNVRRIVIKKDERVLLEIPLTVGVGAGAAAVLLSPMLAAIGALAALVTDVTLVVEREEESEGGGASKSGASENSGGNSGGGAESDSEEGGRGKGSRGI
ncbi:MAG TPA: DUF4342 domain-containing protein [Rubricoccaceae bacterium]|nr:DUF4342 domain-containing protein [Rubricoccaceae bacterium]